LAKNNINNIMLGVASLVQVSSSYSSSNGTCS